MFMPATERTNDPLGKEYHSRAGHPPLCNKRSGVVLFPWVRGGTCRGWIAVAEFLLDGYALFCCAGVRDGARKWLLQLASSQG